MSCPQPGRFLSLAASIVLVFSSLITGTAVAEPKLQNVSPRGLQIGGTTTLVVEGADLLPEPRLLLPWPGARQTVKAGGTAKRVEIEVTLDDTVQPGIAALRVASGKGVSSPVAIGVDRLPQQPFAAEADGPVAMHGNLGGAQILRTNFVATKGATWLFDVEARRLGSGVRPVLRLYDERGTQVAWSAPRRGLDGDARVQHTFQSDGQYTVELHEPLYRGGNPSFFRLKMGSLATADLALPLAVTKGIKVPVQLIGSGETVEVEQDVTTAVAPGYRPATLPAGSESFTGAAPSLVVSDHAELVEAAPAEGQPLQVLPAAPVAVSGKLSKSGEEDKYALPVTPGQKLKIEVLAQQLGSPVDGVLSIRNAQGGHLAKSDDRPGTSDPGLDFTVPAGVEQLQLAIGDLREGGGADFVYRISVKDLAQPDFSLSLAADHVSIPAGGTSVVPISVQRMGYQGPIEVSVDGLPADVQVAGNRIAADASMGLLTFTATGTSTQAVLTTIVGKSVDTPQPIVRMATFGDVPGSRAQPYLRQSFAIAVGEPAPLALTWQPQAEKLCRGSKLPVAVSLQRKEGTQGDVRLRLVSTQPIPTKTIKENNKDKTVDAPELALRLEGDVVIAAGQTEASTSVLVPGDLANRTWDLAIVADLLAADKKTVVASVASPVRSFAAEAPFTIELTSAPEAEGKAGAGPAGKLTGKVRRTAGYREPVVVSLEGLGKDVTAPSVLVAGDQSEFELPLVFPQGSKEGELKNTKLVALSTPVDVRSTRSNSLPVKLKVVAGEKPAVEQPREVFEDDDKFAALLTEGGGQAVVVAGQKYSGEKALRVTPDQKLNPKLPNLGVAIRENPGPGEYRYLQFAWKKQGGTSICLQLNHDGNWGPSAGGRPEASFRYHAGPGPECFGASVQVSSELPNDFVLVTRDLFADFGEFTLTGLAFSPVDAQQAFYDHIYLARTPQEFDLTPPKNK